MSEERLKEAIQLVKNGNKVEAAKLLSSETEDNPSSEIAWLWLSACYDDTEKKRFYINKVLEINPDNETANNALEKLSRIEEPSLDLIAPDISQTTSLDSSEKKQSAPKRKWGLLVLLVVGISIVVFLIVTLFDNSIGDNFLGVISPSSTPTPNIQELILGEWSCPDEIDGQPDQVRWVFFNGGVKVVRFWEYDNQFHSSELFDYSFTDNNIIKIKDFLLEELALWGYQPEDRLYRVIVNGDSLSMRSADGNPSFSTYICEKR